MKRNTPRTACAAAMLLCLAAGCGSKAVPVGGRVTLDSKPLAGVQVIFEPTDGMPEDTSTGETDADGQYSLLRVDGSAGALLGSHRVKLTTLRPDFEADERTRLPRDRVPMQYRDGSLTFDVPENGTTSADFALESR